MAREKRERKEHRERKAKLKSRSKWIKDAQENAFNPYIRKRDRGRPCISCGRTEAEVEGADGWRPGGAWDCGHYLSVAAKPELRFHPWNAWRQCKSCNGGSGKYARKNYTVSAEYRERLIKEIGLKNVEWLEGPHEPQKWTIEEIAEIKQYYKDKIKEIG